MKPNNPLTSKRVAPALVIIGLIAAIAAAAPARRAPQIGVTAEAAIVPALESSSTLDRLGLR